jgi:deoxyribonucleoside regulator
MDKIWQRLQLALEAAKLYYQQDCTQQEIATRLNISRPQVSRLLQFAKEQGIVQVTIQHPNLCCAQLAEELVQCFGLKDAIVVPGLKQRDLRPALGKVAADYLHQLVQDDQVIGLPWGFTMREMAKALQPKKVTGLKVVQLKGGVARLTEQTTTSQAVAEVATKLGGIPYFLPAPAFVDNRGLRDSLIQESTIAEILALGRKCEIAIFSIGRPSSQSVLVQAGYFTSKQMDAMAQQGAVGDISSRYFTIEGTVFDPELDSRTIGITLAEIRQIPYAIAVAGGERYVPAILGALWGGYLNVLVTDDSAAQAILKASETATMSPFKRQDARRRKPELDFQRG